MFNPLTFYEFGKSKLIFDIIAYFNFNSNSQDFVSQNVGTDTAITYTSGKLNNAATFNGTSSKILINHHPKFNFCDATSDKPFSIGMYVKFEKTTDQWLVSKRIQTATGHMYQFFYAGGLLQFNKVSLGNPSNYYQVSVPFTPTLNQWYFIIYTDNGGTGGKIYIDGTSTSTSGEVGSYVRMSPVSIANINIGYLNINNTRYLKGQIDCLAFFNKELSASEVSQIQAKIDAGNEIISY